MNEWVQIKSQRNHWGSIRWGELEEGQNVIPVPGPPLTAPTSDLEAGSTADSCLLMPHPHPSTLLRTREDGCALDVSPVMTWLQLSPLGFLGQTSFLPEHTHVRGIHSREHAHAAQTFCYLRQKITCSAPVPAHSRCPERCFLFVPIW